jgi:TolB-like protein/Tfp pilus assembly protein PilF
LRSLEKAAETRDAWLNWALVEPVFDKISIDPRFSELLASVDHPGLKADIPSREPKSDASTFAGRVGAIDGLTTLVMEPGDSPAGERALVDVGRAGWRVWAFPTAAVFLLTAAAWGLVSIYWPASRPASLVFAPQNSSIVVLPFSSQSASDNDLGVGLADALTNKLGSVKALQVISANSGRSVSSADPVEIGRDLNVGFVARGNIERRPDGTFVTVEVVNTRDATVVWRRDFPARDEKFFLLESDIAENVLRTLRVEPLPFEKQQIAKNYTTVNSAYELYLIGRYQMSRRSAEDLRKAIETFSAATKEDPQFARAYVGLADAYSLLMVYDIEPPKDAANVANEYALKALSIDDNLAEAHASLGYLRFYYGRSRDAAELEFRRAIQLNPSYAQAHHWFSVALSAMNRPVEAVSEAKLAQRLDPRSLSIRSAVAMALFYNRQYAEAVNECDGALSVDNSFVPALKVKRWTYSTIGDLAAARDVFQKEFLVGNGRPDDAGWQVIELQVNADRSDRAVGLEKLNRLASAPDITKNPFAFAYEVALAYNAFGDVEKAVDWLEKAEAAHSYSFNFILVDPRLDNLREHPRFYSLAKVLQR